MLEANKPTFDFSGSSGAPPPAAAGGAAGSTAVPMAAQAGASSNIAYSAPTFDPASNSVVPAAPDHGGYKGIHPIAAAFHVIFKVAALLTFILGGLLSSNYVVIFVITVLFVAADFWTTKNVTGRILVSLRWWNEVREDGSTEWVFESAPESDSAVNAYDSWFFWITTGGYCAVWALMFLFNLMSPTRLPIVVVGFLLSGANLWGYIKCSRDAKNRVTQFMLSQAAQRPNVVREAASTMFAPPPQAQPPKAAA